jgi:hypothetical protein
MRHWMRLIICLRLGVKLLLHLWMLMLDLRVELDVRLNMLFQS